MKPYINALVGAFLFTVCTSAHAKSPYECGNSRVVSTEKIATCDQLIDGNVNGDSRATYTSFVAEYTKDTIEHTPCDPSLGVATTVQYSVQPSEGRPQYSLTGLKSGSDYGTLYIANYSPGESEENAKFIKTTLNLTGVPSHQNVAVYNKETKQLEIQSKSKHYFSDGIVGHILVQCH